LYYSKTYYWKMSLSQYYIYYSLVATAVLGYLFYKMKKKPSLPLPPKDSNKIILNTHTHSVPYSSPFVLKLMAYFNACGVDYTLRVTQDFSESPNGKLPYIFYRQEILQDSHFIIKRLITDGILRDYDAALSPEQKAQAELLRHSAEFVLYYAIVKQRWQDNWDITKITYFKALPWYLYYTIPDYFFLPAIMKQLMGSGVNRYLPGRWDTIVDETFGSMSVFLGEKKYFLGKLSTLDFGIFGQLVSIYGGKTLNPKAYEMMIKYENLVRFTQEMSKMFLNKEISS